MINKYRLIKYYPGSPEKLGTVIRYNNQRFTEEDGTLLPSYIKPEDYPEFWQPVDDPLDLTIEHITSFIRLEVFRSGNGGQHVNRAGSVIKLSCNEFDLNIVCGYYRSALQNRNTCLKLLQLFLNDLNDSVKQHYINLWKESNTPTTKK